MRTINRLSARAVQTLGPGKYADGGGLWLYRREDGGAQWFLRYTIHGRRREMGLGTFPLVSLKEVREVADKWRAVLRSGKDPIKERERERREAARNVHLLADVARDAFEVRKSQLKADGKKGNWFSPILLHILPKLGKIPVAELDQNDIRTALSPIWNTKPETARKALSRLGICLQHAAALGLDVDMQATAKARALLGKQTDKSRHIPSMPWQEVPAYFQSLSDGSPTHLAMRLLILTGARSAMVRNIHVDQIAQDVWTIPGEDMKGRRDETNDFRIPLSHEAMKVIEEARRHERRGLLFANPRKGIMSDMTLSQHMKRAGLEYRPHGFRSSLRDWIEENTNTPYEVAEMVLAHVVGSKTERAYRRTDYLDQRRVLMEAWGEWVSEGVD
ncbi:MAG: integrase arm-type DNA-binding domain-containing protein [Nitratireductor sp.]|nr:integrase arm-type DNA-binding domain-containing protein [Nitratireductor sp.]